MIATKVPTAMAGGSTHKESLTGEVKVGVIGCGYWGPQHARNLHELPGAQLAWVCDLAQERLDHVGTLYPEARTTCDHRDVLASDADAVIIATPASTHHRLALEALRAGKHVLVEKPLTASVHQAEEIVAEGDRLGRVVMVGHTFEYNPAVEAMKAILDSGELGQLYYISGTRVNLRLFQPDINVVWDLAPHDVSILRFILGMDPVKVSAWGSVCVQVRRGIHDVAYLGLRFPNGVLAELRLSWLDPCKIRRYTIVGSRKMLVYDDIEPANKIVIYDKGVEALPYSDTEQEFHLSYRRGEATPYPVRWAEPLQRECEHFVQCIREGKEPRSSARDGLCVVKTLEAVHRSLLYGETWEEIVW